MITKNPPNLVKNLQTNLEVLQIQQTLHRMKAENHIQGQQSQTSENQR
jgi:hypothetical protein